MCAVKSLPYRENHQSRLLYGLVYRFYLVYAYIYITQVYMNVCECVSGGVLCAVGQ